MEDCSSMLTVGRGWRGKTKVIGGKGAAATTMRIGTWLHIQQGPKKFAL